MELAQEPGPAAIAGSPGLTSAPPEKPLKILVVSSLYAPNELGGAEITARAIAERLAAEGNEVVAVSIAPDGEERSATLNGVRCHYVRLANLFWLHTPGLNPSTWQKLLWHLIDAYNPIMGRRLARLIERERPDVVHMHNLQGFSVAAWRAASRLGVPVVQTLHDYYLSCPNSVMFKNGRNCTAPCLECRVLGVPRQRLSGLPHTVTAVSHRLLERLEGRGLFGDVRHKLVISNCNLEEPDPPARADKAPGEPVRFGFFGRIEPVKGVETLLKAMSQLPPERAGLVIGGRAPPDYLAELRRAAPPTARFLGFVRPPEFFAQIDMLVVPSIWEEPQGRVAHEAFSYGVPVLASAIGGLPEMIEPGVNGELFPAGDAARLAEIMKSLVEAGFPAGRYFAGARASSRSYTLERILGQYREVLAAAVR